MYKCSDCSRPIGVFLDRRGKPEMFICPHTGNAAHTIPREAIARKPVKINKSLLGEDLSRRASKRAS